MSNSQPLGQSITASVILSTVSTNASRLLAAAPRTPEKRIASLVSSIISFTIFESTGSRRTATSEITSVKIPPTPIVRTFPRELDVIPTSASTPFGTKVSTKTLLLLLLSGPR